MIRVRRVCEELVIKVVEISIGGLKSKKAGLDLTLEFLASLYLHIHESLFV